MPHALLNKIITWPLVKYLLWDTGWRAWNNRSWSRHPFNPPLSLISQKAQLMYRQGACGVKPDALSHQRILELKSPETSLSSSMLSSLYQNQVIPFPTTSFFLTLLNPRCSNEGHLKPCVPVFRRWPQQVLSPTSNWSDVSSRPFQPTLLPYHHYYLHLMVTLLILYLLIIFPWLCIFSMFCSPGYQDTWIPSLSWTADHNFIHTFG